MVLLAGAPQQRLIRHVLDERMLERVGGLRREPPLIQELRGHQLVQSPLHDPLIPRGHGAQQRVGKLTPQGGPELCQGLHRREAVESRHQRVVQGGGNGQRVQGPAQLIALLTFLEQAGFEHHLGQFFEKQRHAIGLGHDLLYHLRWQRLAVRHSAGQLCGLAPRQARERHLSEM